MLAEEVLDARRLLLVLGVESVGVGVTSAKSASWGCLRWLILVRAGILAGLLSGLGVLESRR